MRARNDRARIGVVIYDGVEPIDLGGTLGVLCIARRVLPRLEDAVIGPAAGPVRLAGGLVVMAPYGVQAAPECDVYVVCGGPGWPQASADPALLAWLRLQPAPRLASVCTGSLVLAAAGALSGRRATTRRLVVGTEERSPLELLSEHDGLETVAGAVVEDGVVTGGGVALGFDTTLYLIARLYGDDAMMEVARAMEYDRALEANRRELGLLRPALAPHPE